MATYKVRGSSHNVIYPYRTGSGEIKQQWESYKTELEAITRHAFIGYLQKKNDNIGLQKAVNEYKQCRLLEKRKIDSSIDDKSLEEHKPISSDNLHRTYREFALKWLPFHARKKRFSPTTYDGYLSDLENHVLPYFGDMIMSRITASDIDGFLDYLSKKPCKGFRSFNKKPKDVPMLSSSSIKKNYNVFISGFDTAKRWGYINEIPSSSAPVEKINKRKAWDYQRIFTFLSEIDDKTLHLAVHLAFVCSLRAGETSAIEIKSIDFHDRSFWITQEIQRVSDKALKVLPQNEIIQVFPKEVSTSKSNLILKLPKTNGSYRKQYLTTPLLLEIKERLQEIEECKEVFGTDYKDYGLLICKPDGRPYDPHSFVKPFKQYQKHAGIAADEQIEFQGLRKSGQMHKVRLSQNNYQLVAENSGQSPAVLMSNYNDILEDEKRTLSLLVETSFYPAVENKEDHTIQNENNVLVASALASALANKSFLAQQIVQLLQASAVNT